MFPCHSCLSEFCGALGIEVPGQLRSMKLKVATSFEWAGRFRVERSDQLRRKIADRDARLVQMLFTTPRKISKKDETLTSPTLATRRDPAAKTFALNWRNPLCANGALTH